MVNDPINPIARNILQFGVKRFLSSTPNMMTLMRYEPMRFTARVPAGKSGKLVCTHPPIVYLRIAPMNPPSPISKSSITCELTYSFYTDCGRNLLGNDFILWILIRVVKTVHTIFHSDSRSLSELDIEKVHLVVTSPPYPMIEMWDSIFQLMNPDIDLTLPSDAFELMHMELDKVWEGIDGVLIEGGIICINIGNATRSLNGSFRMYPSNVRITQKFIELGYSVLPEIIWRKQSTAPNKFMGSGMLPPNAYVTQEHEYILIFRKGGLREDLEDRKQIRRSSAYFWEERNMWFSDLWNLVGTQQSLEKGGRKRSAAYPFELVYRLIQMFSVKGDVVLDPFLGTGTTSLASIASVRSSIGVELDQDIIGLAIDRLLSSISKLQQTRESRLKNHSIFVSDRISKGKVVKYHNEHIDTPVVTKQEKELTLEKVVGLELLQDSNPCKLSASYE